MSQCSSLYGCHLWNLDDNKVKEIHTAWNVCCRKILGLNPRTRTYLLAPLMKSMPIENMILHRITNFFLNGLNHSNRIVKTFFMNVFLSNSSIMKRNINTIRKKLNIKFDDLLNLNKKALKIEFEKNNTPADWRVNMIQELLSIRENQLECELNPYDVKEFLQHISTFR